MENLSGSTVAFADLYKLEHGTSTAGSILIPCAHTKVCTAMPSAGLRPLLRHFAVSAIALRHRVLPPTGVPHDEPRVHVLLCHGVEPEEERQFERFLDWLALQYQIVSYSDAVDRLLQNQVDAPYLAITFDDGLASCLTASKVLQRRGLSGCFFVCPEMIEGQPPSHLRDSPDGPMPAYLDWKGIDTLHDRGQEVGSHTMSHPNLAGLGREQLLHELGRSRDIITQRYGDCEHFAWPFGRFADFSQEAARAVFELGYRSCASGVRGCLQPTTDLDPPAVCIYRDNVEMRWPMSHARYFIERSARQPIAADATWPGDWRDALELPMPRSW